MSQYNYVGCSYKYIKLLYDNSFVTMKVVNVILLCSISTCPETSVNNCQETLRNITEDVSTNTNVEATTTLIVPVKRPST